jgi:VanZ family protein
MLPNFPLLLSNPRFRRLCLGSALLMYALILVAGSIPGARADIGELAPGAVLHSTAYAVLAFLWFVGSTGSAAARSFKAVLAVAVMGAGDEYVQSFFPYRHADVHDWFVDCTAALIMTAILSLTLRQSLPSIRR